MQYKAYLACFMHYYKDLPYARLHMYVQNVPRRACMYVLMLYYLNNAVF
jgi:hypothetical protein